jgi:hypothetical protein
MADGLVVNDKSYADGTRPVDDPVVDKKSYVDDRRQVDDRVVDKVQADGRH